MLQQKAISTVVNSDKERQTPMLRPDVMTYTGGHPDESAAASVYCSLFDDRVAERVCHLLRKELDAWQRSDAACRGCFRRWLR